MITLPLRTYTVTGGVAPYEYTWTASNLCVSFDHTTGTSENGIFPIVISALNETCLQSESVTLSVVDANDCPSSLTINLSNVCNNLTLGDISQTDSYTFTVSASSPQCGQLNYDWSYDTTLFTTIGLISNDSGSSIQLQPIDGVVFPATTNIAVTVTDCVGCSKTSNLSFAICKPLPENITYNMYCNDDLSQYIGNNRYLPEPVGCSGYDFNWSTIQYGPINPGITLTGSERILSATADISLSPGTYSVDYSVENTDGIRSLQGTITIVINSCASGNTIFLPISTFTVECDVLAGDTIQIPITYSTSDPSVEIDWSTWSLIDPPTPLSPSITHGTDVNGNHVINYEVPGTPGLPPTGADSFLWTVCDTLGNCASTATYTIILDCGEGPDVFADTACVECGQSVTIDVLANDDDLGTAIQPSTVTIVTAPTYGVATPLNDGTIVYTPTSTPPTGQDTFTYRVANVSSYWSDPATVTVDVLCAGEDVVVEACNS
jgi:hypothetical protein